jgi:hypothetical protein
MCAVAEFDGGMSIDDVKRIALSFSIEWVERIATYWRPGRRLLRQGGIQMKPVVAITLAASVAGCLTTDYGAENGKTEPDTTELVGKRVPPLPDGMYGGGGACIGNRSEDRCHRSVSVLMSSKGKRIGVYAAVSDGRDEKGSAFWIVTDVMPYPKVDKGHDLAWGSCRYDSVEDNSVVAVVRNSKQPWLRAVGWAYRVEDISGRFIKLDIMHVDCANTALEAD